MNLGLIKNFTSAGAIAKYRIVATDATSGVVKQATAATDKIIGCTGVAGVDAADKRIDVCMDDIRDIEFGGDVEFGDLLTSDAQGRAVVAAPAAGANVRIVGTAMEDGAIGVIGKVHVIPSSLQG
jgi:hypothetical protein